MSKNTGSGYVRRNAASADQLAKWREALAATRRQQRQQRWKRKRGLAAVAGPGMMRIMPGRGGDGDGDRGEVDGPHGE
jgi:hypothetical protein